MPAAAATWQAADNHVAQARVDVTSSNATALPAVVGLGREGPIDIRVNDAGMQFRTALGILQSSGGSAGLPPNVSSLFPASQPMA